MKINEIIRLIEDVAPRALQESYDNSGLQVGDPSQECVKTLFCIDITEEVIDEAVSIGANLVISHHPLIFKGLKSITGRDYIERSVIKAIQNNICLYAAHTNLDNAWAGVNFMIANKIGLTDVEILDPKADSLIKLVTFVPVGHAELLRQALFSAGAGGIGNYDSCSYNTEGIGTFRAGNDSDPFCGEKGMLHSEAETRIEVILPSFLKNRVLQTLKEVHPYEEPACDFIPLDNLWHHAGGGIVGFLPEPMMEIDFLKKLKKDFDAGCVKHSKFLNRKISKVALCGGSASFLIPNAIATGADIYITGEIKYHDFFGNDEKILLADIGHYESEQFTIQLIADIILKKEPAFVFQFTKVNTNPINYL